MMVIVCREFGWTFTDYLAQPYAAVKWAWDFVQGETRGRNSRTEDGDA